jgi:hypothetical protein
MVDEAIERALRRLRIPSHHDIDRLNERVDKLSAELKKTNPNGVKPRAGKRSR